MSWAAAATVAAGAIGAYSSDKASDAASDAANRSATDIRVAGNRARNDVEDIFPSASRELFRGSSGAFDIFNQALGQQQQALGQGNLQAQGTVSSSLPQIQAALMGLPTDFSGLQPQSVQPQQGFSNPFTGTTGAMFNIPESTIPNGTSPTGGGYSGGYTGTPGGNNLTVNEDIYQYLPQDERSLAQRTFNPLVQARPELLSEQQIAALRATGGRVGHDLAGSNSTIRAFIEGSPIERNVLNNLSGFSNF